MNSLVQILKTVTDGVLEPEEEAVRELIRTIIDNHIAAENHLVSYVNLFDVERNNWVGKAGIIFYSRGIYSDDKVVDDFKNLGNTLAKNKAESLRTYVYERGKRNYPIIVIKKDTEKSTSYSYDLHSILLEVEASYIGAARLSRALGLQGSPKVERDIGIIFKFLCDDHISKYDWNFIYYFVTPVIRERSVSGVSIFTRDTIAEDKFISLIGVLDSLFAHLDLKLIETPLRKHALRSAIAAIMARNMSHNIGSHVLASTELLKGVHRNEIQKLHSFLQKRMDFIAQVVTYTPSWGETMFFFNDLLQGFLNQYLLLGHLIKDQGYYEKIKVIVHFKGKDLLFEKDERNLCENCGRPCETAFGEENCQCETIIPVRTGSWIFQSELNKVDDFIITVPGGEIGAHAFYDILENYMRNSAKYGERQDAFELHIGLEEDDERFHITVWDNLSRHGVHNGNPDCFCRVCRVQRSLREELINPATGEMEVQSRGVHEMKECARILAYPYKNWGFQLNQKHYHLLAEATTYKDQEYLSLQFYLQKPRLVGIVHTSGLDDSEAPKAGVFHYTDLQELINYAHQFGIIYMPDNPEEQRKTFEFLKERHHLLPYRLLLVAGNKIDDTVLRRNFAIPSRRVLWCTPSEMLSPQADNEQNWLHFAIQIYELWVKKFKQSINGTKWQLLIAFDRGDDHSAFTRWRDGLKGFHSNVVDIHIIGPRSNHNGINLIASTSFGSANELKTHVEKNPNSWFCFDNHRKGIGELNFDASKLHFYHDFGVNTIKLYQALESPPPPGFGFEFFVLGLLESALTSVLVIDERVAEATFDEKEGFAKGLLGDFREAELYPTFSVWTKGEETQERTFVSDAILRHNDSVKQNGLVPIDEQEGVDFKSDQPIVKIQRFSDIGEAPGVDEKTQFDCIIIHQGVIDRLDNLKRWNEETYLAQLYELSPSVVITSGRGHTLRHVPTTMPFIEFSIVRENTYAGLSKYHLVRALMSVSGKKEGVSQ
ncbi:MAG: hypothetical protein DKINENOH_01714 [bacterium]|nr:hypothetical protein [bacterium]